MATNPISGMDTEEWSNFWSEQQEDLIGILAPYTQAAILQGAAAGADAVAMIVSDWGLVDKWARDFAYNYSYNLVKNITEESQAMLEKQVGDWIQSGKHLKELEKELEPDFGPIRADMISSTEVTRAFAKGNLYIWEKSPDVIASAWFTAEDELVCDICGGLADAQARINESYHYEGPHGNDIAVESPPAHVRCRCSLRPVTIEGIHQH